MRLPRAARTRRRGSAAVGSSKYLCKSSKREAGWDSWLLDMLRASFPAAPSRGKLSKIMLASGKDSVIIFSLLKSNGRLAQG